MKLVVEQTLVLTPPTAPFYVTTLIKKVTFHSGFLLTRTFTCYQVHQHFTTSFFCTKVSCAAFICLQFVFVLCWQKEIGAKAARKMLVNLTTVVKSLCVVVVIVVRAFLIRAASLHILWALPIFILHKMTWILKEGGRGLKSTEILQLVKFNIVFLWFGITN